ncbi:MAG: DNA repair exonuclease [Isosphaeraceae bacterium]|nr:DNA repair exonuclease [Isosphaeraceae bacterium]
MFRFIHAADIHLDSPLRGLDAYQDCPADSIRNASRRAFENLVRLAIDERVAFVVIAGDVFDGEWKDHNTGLFFTGQMAALRDAGIPVVSIKGNHDAESKIPNGLRLPDSVHMLPTERPSTIILDDFDVAIHGQGFRQAKIEENLALGYPRAEPGRFNIGLLHTCAAGSEDHARYAPCSVEDLTQARLSYDYWALGHVHNRATLREGEPFIGFSGNLQGRHVRETGPKGCSLVTVIPGEKPRVEFRALDVFRWQSRSVDVSGCNDLDAVVDAVGSELRGALAASDGLDFAIRLLLQGVSPAHHRINAEPQRLRDAVREEALALGSGRIWVERIVDASQSPRDSRERDQSVGLEELAEAITALSSDPDELRKVVTEELADLLKKLRSVLPEPERSLGLDTVDGLESLLSSARPLIERRLESR